MVGGHPEGQGSFWPGHPSEIGKPVEGVVGQSRSHGDPGHGVEDVGKRRVDQREGPGMGALEGRSPGRGPGKEALNHWVEEDYACNPEEHTVAAGRDTLRKITPNLY